MKSQQQQQQPQQQQQVKMQTTNAAAAAIKDDYGDIDLSKTDLWTASSFTLENGIKMQQLPVRYQTYGTLNSTKSNVLIVCHALTGHPVVDDWWGALLGDGKPFDTAKYFVLCANMLGSCYGSGGPTTINPATGRAYGPSFPHVTIRDTVNIHGQLLTHLGVTHVAAVVGGSIGGMQALEWTFLDHNTTGFTVGPVVALACGARQSAWAIALNHIQRNSITTDPHYNNGNYTATTPPKQGLAAARQLAMCSYRTHTMYNQKFGRRQVTDKKSSSSEEQETAASVAATAAAAASLAAGGVPQYEIESYLQYQGAKFYSRYDANSYIRMSQQTDSHDVGRSRGGHVKALRSIQQPVLVVGITSDVLYPTSDQQELKEHIPHAELLLLLSPEGHDGFLLEQKAVAAAIQKFFATHVHLAGAVLPPKGHAVVKCDAHDHSHFHAQQQKSKL